MLSSNVKIKQMKKSGEFQKQKQKHKARQDLYEKVVRIRKGETVFISIGNKRFSVKPGEYEFGLSLVFIKGDKTPTIVESYVKDGKVFEYQTDRVVGENSIKEWVGIATEL